MSNLDALEEIADSTDTHPNVGSRRPIRANPKGFAIALESGQRGARSKLKRIQRAYLTNKHKREGM